MVAPERRRTHRVIARDAVAVADPHRPGRLCFVNMSLGGLLLETDAPYDEGHITDLAIASHEGGWSIRLTARTVYCHQVDENGSAFMTGWAFVDTATAPAGAEIQALFERVVVASLGTAAEVNR
jgi:hypothetical protein